MRTYVDGNFKDNHLMQKNDGQDVWLVNGEGFMTNTDRYEMHLQTAKESKSVSPPIQLPNLPILHGVNADTNLS